MEEDLFDLWLGRAAAVVGLLASAVAAYMVADLAAHGALSRWVDRQTDRMRRQAQAARDLRKAEAHAVWEATEIVDEAKRREGR